MVLKWHMMIQTTHTHTHTLTKIVTAVSPFTASRLDKEGEDKETCTVASTESEPMYLKIT